MQNTPPAHGYEITFEVEGQQLLICCVAADADTALRNARSIAADGGYDGDCRVIRVQQID